MLDNFLIEIQVEELPLKSLKKLGQEFSHKVREVLGDAGFCSRSDELPLLVSPRRIAALIPNVANETQPEIIECSLVPLSIAFTSEGQPSPALCKKIKSKSWEWEDIKDYLYENHAASQPMLYCRYPMQPKKLEIEWKGLFHNLIHQWGVDKAMRWGVVSQSFVRPVHGLIALYGSTIVPCSLWEHDAGRQTVGHRTLSPGLLSINSASTYIDQLREHSVLVHYNERSQVIHDQMDSWIQAHPVVTRRDEDSTLWEETVALTEWPTVYAGDFPTEYLQLPQECLALAMRGHQKYFALYDATGQLYHQFFIVANHQPEDPSDIIEGNIRVIKARFSDALFFWNCDIQCGLPSFRRQLDQIVFHHMCGSQKERTERITDIVLKLINSSLVPIKEAALAAQYCKADLCSEMVKEFPELQGVMGGYYAHEENFSVAIAQAIAEHYDPKGPQDDLPISLLGQYLSLADKLDYFFCFLSIQQLSTGEKDPYALRRIALATIRLLIEGNMGVNLQTCLDVVTDVHQGHRSYNLSEEDHFKALSFYQDRLKFYCSTQGFSFMDVENLLHDGWPQRLPSIIEQLQAVVLWKKYPTYESWLLAAKRIYHILKANKECLGDESLLADGIHEERTLYLSWKEIDFSVSECCAQGEWLKALELIAMFAQPVHEFFDKVLVSVEDVTVRRARLALLWCIQKTCERVIKLTYHKI